MRILVVCITAFFIMSAHAEGLEEGKTYRLNKTVYDAVLARDDTKKFIVVKDSKFRVVDTSNADHYIVNFVTLYNYKPAGGSLLRSTVRLDEEYILKRTVSSVSLEKSVSASNSGLVSGPLIIPFKYRIGNNSLSGDAAIGYFAGISAEPKIPWTEVRVPISPFIAGGLSQVSVTENSETTNRTGITLAIGILVQGWDGLNIGLVYGQDRIGESTWEHEGEGWISFMVGWDLKSKRE